MPSTAELLDAWEAGLAAPPLDQAPALLRLLSESGEPVDPRALTVGECDRRLVELRRLLFGPGLEVTGSCPVCREPAEFHLQLAGFEQGEVPPAVSFDVDGYRMTCRLPTNADLGHVAGLGDAARPADLLQRCLLTCAGPEGPLEPGDPIPSEVTEPALRALADNDPGAEIVLALRCPACQAEWPEVLDIRAVLWAELTAWAHGVLAEVHVLAASYGWSESDILGLSSWRRRHYLEACGW